MFNKANIQLATPDACTGCAACYNACPKQCISMSYNIEGFSQPLIDVRHCLQCRRCEKACPVLSYGDGSTVVAKAWTAQTADNDVLKNSSSGGAFYEIARWVISQKGGVVFGVRFDGYHVQHDYADTLEGVEVFMGSKYVQSDVRNTFQQAKEFLLQDRWVLYTGTPCQIAGLKKFLGRPYEKLLTVDLICHGVPSPVVWERYAKGLAERLQVKESKVIRFRYKKEAKDKNNFNYYYYYYYLGQDNKEHEFVETRMENLFYSYFSRHVFRESCYHCKYRNTDKTVADITIGDVLNASDRDIHDGLVSTVISHSNIGEEVLDSISDNFYIWEDLDLSKLDKYYDEELKTEVGDNQKVNRRLSSILACRLPLRMVKPIFTRDRIGIIIKRKIKKYVKKI